MPNRLRIFYAADIHGSEQCFRKFLNAAKAYEADAIILGGDITGKILVPIVKRKDGSFYVKVFGQRHYGANPEDLLETTAALEDSGLYPQAISEEELDELIRDPAQQKSLFQKAMHQTIRRWIALAEERLAGTRTECYIMPGNDDDPRVGKILSESARVVNPDLRVVTVCGHHEMVSVSYTNPTPFSSPGEMEEDELEALIARLANSLHDGTSAIFNLHCPPHGTSLDLAPELDGQLKIKSYGGRPKLVPVGSFAVCQCIEKFQPSLSLHGHIHESRGVAKIGRTISLNPGSDYSEGILRGVIVDLNGPEVYSYQFVAG